MARALGMVSLALLGEIVAGKPGEGFPRREWLRVQLPAHLRRARDLFLLRVRGDSLIEAGITDGSLAICRRMLPQGNGELCAVLTPDGMTLKYVHWQRGGKVVLRGANPKYKPVCYYAEDIQVQGVVVLIERGV